MTVNEFITNKQKTETKFVVVVNRELPNGEVGYFDDEDEKENSDDLRRKFGDKQYLTERKVKGNDGSVVYHLFVM